MYYLTAINGTYTNKQISKEGIQAMGFDLAKSRASNKYLRLVKDGRTVGKAFHSKADQIEEIMK